MNMSFQVDFFVKKIFTLSRSTSIRFQAIFLEGTDFNILWFSINRLVEKRLINKKTTHYVGKFTFHMEHSLLDCTSIS